MCAGIVSCCFTVVVGVVCDMRMMVMVTGRDGVTASVEEGRGVGSVRWRLVVVCLFALPIVVIVVVVVRVLMVVVIVSSGSGGSDDSGGSRTGSGGWW